MSAHITDPSNVVRTSRGAYFASAAQDANGLKRIVGYLAPIGDGHYIVGILRSLHGWSEERERTIDIDRLETKNLELGQLAEDMDLHTAARVAKHAVNTLAWYLRLTPVHDPATVEAIGKALEAGPAVRS